MSTNGTFQRSWQLFGSSLRVMKENRKLLLFPLIISIFSILIVLCFAVPVILLPSGHAWSDKEHWEILFSTFMVRDASNPNEYTLSTTGYACMAVIYLVSMFVATFCNVAFYSQIMKALAGQAVSIREGFSFAMQRIFSIFVWSFFAGLVGLLIRMLEERFGLIGRIVMGLVGVVWSVASVFAIPVIVMEESCNPLRILRSSAETIRKTWGESLVGYVGIQLGGWIVLFTLLPFALLGALVWMMLGPEYFMTTLIGLGVLWFVAVLACGYLLTVAGDIFRCALYLYASSGVVPSGYNADALNNAWKLKKVKSTA